MQTKIYAGIGSRESNEKVNTFFGFCGSYLASNGYTLRSGGADGSDLAFEKGCDRVKGKKEIYIPWKDFNGSNSSLYNITEEAKQFASKYHPAWKNLKDSVRNLMARNCYQVLGYDLKTPVDFIICWTSDGKASGGTGQTIRIANDYNIKVYNIENMEDVFELKSVFNGMDKTGQGKNLNES